MIDATNFKQYGWICPVCGRVLSPWTHVCPCYNETETTTNTYKAYTGKSYTYSTDNRGEVDD